MHPFLKSKGGLEGECDTGMASETLVPELPMAMNLLWSFGYQLLRGSVSFLMWRQTFRRWGTGIVVSSQDDLFLVYCGHVNIRADAGQKVYVFCLQNQQTTSSVAGEELWEFS